MILSGPRSMKSKKKYIYNIHIQSCVYSFCWSTDARGFPFRLAMCGASHVTLQWLLGLKLSRLRRLEVCSRGGQDLLGGSRDEARPNWKLCMEPWKMWKMWVNAIYYIYIIILYEPNTWECRGISGWFQIQTNEVMTYRHFQRAGTWSVQKVKQFPKYVPAKAHFQPWSLCLRGYASSFSNCMQNRLNCGPFTEQFPRSTPQFLASGHEFAQHICFFKLL